MANTPTARNDVIDAAITLQDEIDKFLGSLVETREPASEFDMSFGTDTKVKDMREAVLDLASSLQKLDD